MGHLPVGMEMFNAADSTQWDIIKRHIDNSDYYVVILAHRYGSTDEDGVSYTEKEYNYAMEIGVPCLGFVISNDASWSPNLIASGIDALKLSVFKEKLKSKMVSFWNSSDNLALHISASLSEAFNVKPRIGWIRSNEITTSPIVAEELSRLSKENAELNKENVELLAQLMTNNKESDEVDELVNLLSQQKYSIKINNTTQREFSLLDIFMAVCKKQNKPDEYTIYTALTGDEDTRMGIQLTDSLSELSLINLVTRAPIGRHTSTYYLTEKGKKVYSKVKYQV